MSQKTPPYPFVLQSHAPDPNYIPARVQVAIRILNDLHDQQHGISVDGETPAFHDGREIHPVEEETRRDAHKMLQAYFAGTLEPSPWEISMAGMDRPVMLTGQCSRCKDYSNFIFKKEF